MTVAEGNRRERTKQANREAILAAARSVFAEIGFGAASVRDIVRRTDLATGTFYNYFEDKEAVFRALVEEAAEAIRAGTHLARSRATTAEAFVADGFLVYFEALTADREASEMLRRNAGTIRAMFDDPAIGQGRAELEEDLRGAIARGLVPEHDCAAMATALTGAGVEIGLRLLEEREPDVDGAVRFMTALVLGGLERMGSARG